MSYGKEVTRKVGVNMERHSTLQRTWFSILNGRPVRVEEHRNDLSYIVEYYDASDDESGECIAVAIENNAELTNAIQQEQAQALM